MPIDTQLCLRLCQLRHPSNIPEIANSGCTTDDVFQGDGTCEGVAALEPSEGGFTLSFGDGSSLAFSSDAIDINRLLELDFAEVDFVKDQYIICPFCGSVPQTTLHLSEPGENGLALFYFTNVRADSSNVADAMLGLPVEEEELCSGASSADCYLSAESHYLEMVVPSSSPTPRPIQSSMTQLNPEHVLYPAQVCSVNASVPSS